MSEKRPIGTGGPAFPVTPTDKSGQIAPTEFGMTLRDYFAAKAMAGQLSNESLIQKAAEACSGDTHHFINTVAFLAYEIADAMLVARSK